MTTTEVPHTTVSPSSARATDSIVGFGMIIGPILGVASSIAWVADAAEPRAILQLWSVIGFALTFVGFSRLLEPATARAAAAVLALGMIACAGGAAYAAEAAIVAEFDIDRLNDQQAASTFLLLRLPGIVFPLTLLVSAFLLGRHRLVGRVRAGLLVIGAVCFPLSRISEVSGLGVAADLVLAAAIVPLGWAAVRPARRSE